MNTFHHPDLLPAVVHLSDEEAGHALRVLRLKDGERVRLVDGRGSAAEGTLRIEGKQEARVEILSRSVIKRERTATIHLAVAPTKQLDRFEWMIEKCTEIGVDRITPLITARSERKHVRLGRLQKGMGAARKQSERAWLPQLDAATTLAELLASELPAQRLFGWCEGEGGSLTTTYDKSRNALVLIGPEGDFTPEEAVKLTQQAFTPVMLGEARLRTETAAIVCCSWMNFAQQAG